MLETENGPQKTEKREKVMVGPGPREIKAEHGTSNCEELCVRWRGLCALGKGSRIWRCQGGCCKQSMVPRRQRKGEKVAAEPGTRECKAGYETNNCGELRVDGEGYAH